MRTVPFNKAALAQVGVEMAKVGSRWVLCCSHCGRTWEVGNTGIIPAGYWCCPAGCNENARPSLRKRPKPEPEPEQSEPDDDALERAMDRERELYGIMHQAAGKAKKPEARARLEAQAQRHRRRLEEHEALAAHLEQPEQMEVQDAPDPKPSEEPELTHPYEVDYKAIYLRNHNFYAKMAREAETDEARERFENESARFLDMYLGLVHNDKEVENELLP